MLVGQSATLLAPQVTIQADVGIGLPTAGNVDSAWSGNTVVQSAFNTPSSVQGLAAFSLAGDTGGAATSDLNFSMNGIDLGSQDLLVGLLNPTTTFFGVTFGSFSMEIERQGVPIFNETFTSNSAFESFFTDNVLDLGPENPNHIEGQLEFSFIFEFNSTSTVSGIFGDLMFGNSIPAVPEPSSCVLLALGALGLLSRAAVLQLRRRSQG